MLRPQPWAGKAQLLQSCCWNGAAMALGMAPINQTYHPPPHPSQLSTPNQSETPHPSQASFPDQSEPPHPSQLSITNQSETSPPSQASTPKPITASISAPTKRIRISLTCLIFLANAIRQISDIRISISIGLGAIGQTRMLRPRLCIGALSYSTAMTNPPPGARCTLSLPSSGMVIWQRL